MKKRIDFYFSLVLFTAVFFGLFWLVKHDSLSNHKTVVSGNSVTELEEEERDNPLEALKQEFEKTKDPKTNTVPTERLLIAYEQLNKQGKYKTNAAVSFVNWTERGPNNQGGRTRAVWVDLTDASGKTVWAGSVGGGLWKTTDITAASPTWTVANDLFGNLAITSITQDPSNPLIMYFCTGEGYSNIDAIRGLGVWKSTNGGASWAQLAATNNSNYYYCNKIFCNQSGVIFVATRTGLYRSATGGTSFAKVLGAGTAGATANNCWDIEMASNGILYATMGTSLGSDGTIHKSVTTTGTSWNNASTLPVVSPGRMELGLAANDSNYVYVMLEKSRTVNSILKSTNAGGTFVSLTKPVDADGGIPAADISRTQAWYDLSIAVDPNNRDIVFVGGVDLFKTANGGTSWTQVSHWYGGFGYQYVHADQHSAFYSPGSSSICYFTNDGGIYRTTNANAASPTISRKDYNYNTAQFYGCAIHPTAGTNYFLAGAQDNGSHKFTTSGINTTTQASGGDGVFCHIDINNGNNQLTSYVYNNLYYSTNGGTSFTGLASDNTGSFVNPSDLDGVNDILYSAKAANQIQRWTNIFSGAPTKTTHTFTMGGGTVTHLKVSPNTATTLYIGTSNGKVIKVTNANGVTPTETAINTGLPAASVSCIEVEKGNENHMLVTFSNFGVNSVWESTNNGSSWTSVEGNLPDMPVRWCLFNPSNNDQAILATELGVWTTDNLNTGTTNWGSTNTGLANVRVDMLKVRYSDSIVIAATHGRGLYSTDGFTSVKSNFSVPKRVIYPGTTVTFTDLSTRASTWAWDFDNNGTTDASVQNPTYTFNTPGYYDVKLTVNGSVAYTYSNCIHVLPYQGTPYTPANGGNFDNAGTAAHFDGDVISGGINLWERGAPGNTLTTLSSAPNAWKTLLNANITQGGYSCALYSPSFNFTTNGTYTLSFKGSMALVFCNAPFGIQVQYSTDHGSTWNRLGINGSGTNWYTSYPAASCVLNSAIFADRYGWNASYSNATMSYDVSFLKGNTRVCFRWVFTAVSGYLASAYTADGFMIDDFQISGPVNSPVPVEFMYFNAVRKEKNVELTWATASEKNNRGFAVQRSADGKTWTEIAFVNGHDNSSVINSYRYTDINAFELTGKNELYYRLNQIDFDGTGTLSPIKSAGITSVKKITVSPNPAADYVVLHTEDLEITNQFNYRIADTQGKTWISGMANPGSSVIELTGLPAGLYFILVTDKENKTNVIKLLKK